MKLVSIETRAKMSAAKMGNTNNLGHKASLATRAKMSMVRMGHTTSAETRQKMSAWQWKCGRAVSRRKGKAKRRLLGFNPLNSWFVGSEGHHINPNDVIYIPIMLHKSVSHNIWTGHNMNKINALAEQYLTEGKA